MSGSARRLRELEDAFVEKFLVAVAIQGRLDFGELDWRFMRAYRVLEQVPDPADVLQDLLNRLRPDPLTGVSQALHAGVYRLQPGRVMIPGPLYKSIEVLMTPVDDGGVLESLGPNFAVQFEAAVQAYLGLDHRQ